MGHTKSGRACMLLLFILPIHGCIDFAFLPHVNARCVPDLDLSLMPCQQCVYVTAEYEIAPALYVGKPMLKACIHIKHMFAWTGRQYLSLKL